MPVELMELAIATFVTMFVIIDPIAVSPIFASMTEGTDRAHQKSMAYRGFFIATCILLFFAFIGKSLLDTLGISMNAFRVAGGLFLFLIAMEMVFEKRTERREKRADKFLEEHEQEIHDHPDDISVFPIAVPLLAGPGAIATIMLQMSSHANHPKAQTAIILSMLAVMVISLIFLLLSGHIMRLAGQSLSTIFTRVLGIILAAMASQFVMDGIKGAFFQQG